MSTCVPSPGSANISLNVDTTSDGAGNWQMYINPTIGFVGNYDGFTPQGFNVTLVSENPGVSAIVTVTAPTGVTAAVTSGNFKYSTATALYQPPSFFTIGTTCPDFSLSVSAVDSLVLSGNTFSGSDAIACAVTFLRGLANNVALTASGPGGTVGISAIAPNSGSTNYTGNLTATFTNSPTNTPLLLTITGTDATDGIVHSVTIDLGLYPKVVNPVNPVSPFSVFNPQVIYGATAGEVVYTNVVTNDPSIFPVALTPENGATSNVPHLANSAAIATITLTNPAVTGPDLTGLTTTGWLIPQSVFTTNNNIGIGGTGFLASLLNSGLNFANGATQYDILELSIGQNFVLANGVTPSFVLPTGVLFTGISTGTLIPVSAANIQFGVPFSVIITAAAVLPVTIPIVLASTGVTSETVNLTLANNPYGYGPGTGSNGAGGGSFPNTAASGVLSALDHSRRKWLKK